MEEINYRNSLGLPPTICIQLLKWCNLTCSFCRAESSRYDKENLDYNDLSLLLKDISKYGKWRLSLSGGEPLYWKRINDLIKLIYELDFPFSLTTSGNSNESIIKQIPTEYWKNGTLHVSIDGNEITHNLLRGEGTFARAIQFLIKVRSHVPKLYVNSVLFVDPSVWAKELFKTLENIGIDNWTILSPVHKGRWDFEKEKLASSLTPQEQFKFIKSIVDSSSSSITTYLFDFAKSENYYSDIVFINSDGEIRLPGFYWYDSNLPDRPLIKSSSIFSPSASKDIVDAVINFLKTEHYML